MDANALVRAYILGARDFTGVALPWARLIKLGLPRIRLATAALSYARFDHAALFAADFADADLKGAWFLDADLRGACFRGAVLESALFHRASLQGADFRNADLQFARFNRAAMDSAITEGANLAGAVMPNGLPAPGAPLLTKAAPNFAIGNRQQLELSTEAGCYHCLAVFDAREVTRYVDNGDTAVCPRCGIEAVLGSATGYRLTRKELKRLHTWWR